MAYRHKRTGNWIATTTLPDGTRTQLGTYELKRDAVQAEREARRQTRSAMTVSEWRDIWLSRYTHPTTRKHNTDRTKRFNERHGGKRLHAVTYQMARDWVDERESDHSALRAMFGAARKEVGDHGGRLIQDNPFAGITKGKPARRNLQADWLTDEDITTLERCAVEVHGPIYGPTIAGAIRFAAETGIRPGELFALEDVDLGDGVVLVRRAVLKDGTIGPPKNGREREAPLSVRAAQAAAGAMRVDGQTLLFATPGGKRFTQQSFRYYWDPVRARFGRPRMHYYELRHLCATRLIEAGLSDYDVSIALGHTDGGDLVRRVYGHRSERRALERVREELDRRAA